MEERIQKILAHMGIASRRKAEEYILEGRVTVNGKTAELGGKADTERDHIKLDGKLLTKTERLVYLAFHKPKAVVTSLFDPEGRPTVKDFLKGVKERVYPVGRLDYDSEGLLILTNDGGLANAIMHPSRKITKVYHVKVKGRPEEDALDKMRSGIRIEGKRTAPAKVKFLRLAKENSWLEISIHEGRKRQIRRMLQRLGHPVAKLKRVQVGSVRLGPLPAGSFRRLTPDEVEALQRDSGHS